ncbi:MAG: hypothetical protein ACKVP3_08385 [Hyphomicrobiaceae bacterium]
MARQIGMIGMLSKTDAFVISALREPWPQPADYPAPVAVAARSSSLKLISSGLFALVLAAMIGIILRENALSPTPFEGWRLWLRIGAAVGIGVLGIVIVVSGVASMLKPKLLVSLGPAGLTVPELFAATLPWSDIRAVLHDKPRVKIFGAGRILIGVRDGHRFGPLPSPDVQPATEPGEFDVTAIPQLLNVPVDRLLVQIQAHRAHYGQNSAKE